MKQTPVFRQVMALLVVTVFAVPIAVHAHEGHKDNMSDAEMVQMEMHEATAKHEEAAGAMHDPEFMAQSHPSADGVGERQTPEQALEAAIAENRVTSTGDFLGRLHPIAAHFPVALLLMAALAELLLALRPALGLETTVRFLVAGGAIGALVAALLGWFAAGWRLSDRSQTLGVHRWNGSAVAGVAILAAWFAFRSNRRSGLRVTLAILAVALVVQGYLGGEMVFGPNHLGLE
ncbi:DUF2231 domain-containing protein [Sphingopyxis granuli]|uniref:DUF2231 domain-containing protein n=1 Tax=Sphingopyxis granuli TaxID=267128 RepID=A0AA86L4M4_9SPHN|nr:DUF2231 domain-containing protein [Sphingopyxis granuli]AMG75160.1 Uncharacterized protein SGRAN_2811 [Sphingopyxis granuli]